MVFGLGMRIKDNPRARKVYYEFRNRSMFGDFHQHDRMLADKVRVDTYYEALSHHIREGDVVIDLGTGSGILSFFAASQNPRRIHALDHSDVIEAAESLAEANGIRNVSFERVNSKSFEIGEKADVIIHEQLGEALFDEKMVENLLDLRDRLLKPGGKILPGKFELFVEPVRLKEEYYVPFVWEQNLHGVDFERMKDLGGGLEYSYYVKNMQPAHFEALLCEPAPIFSIDLHEAETPDLPTSLEYRKPVVNPGPLHGFCVYFEAHFDDERHFGNAPWKRNTSWLLPLLRVEKGEYESGQNLHFRLAARDLSDVAAWNWSSD